MTTVEPVLIVGAGFSGTMVAANLAKLGISCVIVDIAEQSGKGVAYSTLDTSHRLNVPAKKMSAWPHLPDDFARFVGSKGVGEDEFASRETYGDYLRCQLEQAVESGLVTLVAGRVESVRRVDGEYWEAQLAGKRQIRSTALVLAMGNSAPSALPQLASVDAADVVGAPWQAGADARLKDAALGRSPVLIVGTSLTMIDMVLTLTRLGHPGPIYAVSRRGLLPRAHRAHPPSFFPAPLLDELPRTVVGLLRWLRHRAEQEDDWRTAVDALRPHTQALWRSLPLAEKRRFLRHARPWWDVHRHRIPADVAERIEDLRGANTLRMFAARITETRKISDENYAVDFVDRAGRQFTLDIGLFINCTGPLSTYGDDPLLARMAADGLIQADGLEMGVAVASDDRVAGIENVFAIGTMTRGTHWEVTAVPDLRVKAADLAKRIAADLAPAEPTTV